MLATKDSAGRPLSTIDGSTWDPWARRLIFSSESPTKPTYAATPGYPSVVEDVSGAIGRGGYEGMQNDSSGNLWIVEDIGGSTKTASGGGATTAKRPNSYIYKYVPARPGDLNHGALYALQVTGRSGRPMTYESQAALNEADQVALHTQGTSLRTRWVRVHDTATDGTAPFDANVRARAAGASPFKRPENGVFRPGSRFGQFVFTETGDTNATSPENPSAGGWGGLFSLVQDGPDASTGRIEMLYAGDQAHTGFDNIAFLSDTTLTAVEDAGDTLHGQRNALDSGYVFTLAGEGPGHRSPPIRWLAEGRDPSATLDAANAGFGKNDGDNEITGVTASDGDPSPGGILGAKRPQPFTDPAWRWFYTQQHGDNATFEVVASTPVRDRGTNGG